MNKVKLEKRVVNEKKRMCISCLVILLLVMIISLVTIHAQENEELGCCFDDEEGLCTPKSIEQGCENYGGVWYNEKACDISECGAGCCVLGSKTEFATQRRCERLSAFYNFPVDFRSEVYTHLDCIALAQTQAVGACVVEEEREAEEGAEKTCWFLTELECLQLTGSLINFHENLFCSNPDLETNCRKTNEKVCSLDEKKVYYLDSCGNLDEVYETCNYPEERCINGICKDMNCKNAPYLVDAQGRILKTRDRVNGESWCVYDGYIGEGKDVVGSRHWKYYCQEGDVKIEPCFDYRQEICVEWDVEVEGEKISEAECRVNRWRECLAYDLGIFDKSEGECEDIIDCELKNINIDFDFSFKRCVGKYPSGFNTWTEQGEKAAKSICGLATQTCIVVKVDGSCKQNCNCETEEFTKKMNDWCISLGDCGGYVNIVEDVDKGYSVSNAPAINLNQYKKYAQPKEGQRAEPGNLTGYDNAAMSRYQQLLDAKIMQKVTQVKKPMPVFDLKWWKELYFGGGETKIIEVQFKCYPWQAPSEGQDCGKCNNNEKTCSEYRCKSLGQACEFINEGTSEQKCIWMNKTDRTAPKISPWEEAIKEGYKYENVSDNGFEIKQGDGKCVDIYIPITFGIKTDDFSQCKYDIEDVKYDDMAEYFGEDNLYKQNHSISLTMPSLEAFANEFNLTYQHVLEKIGDMRFYVKCKDVNGNVNPIPYLIDICVKAGPDLTAPMILSSEPETRSYVKYGATKQEVFLYVNEPAECRWSLYNKNYEIMENNMNCKTGLYEASNYGWECKDTLPLTSEKFYFRCKDQPWEEDKSKRNVNVESFVYELKKSASELKITKIEPEGEIISNIEPVSVILKVSTSGGAENGKAECYFEWNNNWILFFETDSSKHEQEDWNLVRGDYIIPIRCEDIAGNEAEGKIKFKLKIDTSTPKVVRVYNSGQLKIITNGDAECAYSFETCNFIWENATKMTGILREHTASWEEGRTYYIKCKDLLGNILRGCSIIVKAV